MRADNTMTYTEFAEIMEGESDIIHDDAAFLGLQIIRKYLPTKGIEGADHDIIYSVNAEELVDAGLTEADARELNRLGWMIEDGECLSCFV